MRRTIPRRKASARTSIVTERSLPAGPGPMHGPDRRAGPPPPKAQKSCRPSRAGPARAIAATSSGTRTPSAVRSRSGLRGPFQMV